MWNFIYFARRQITFILFFFFPGVIVSTEWSYIVSRGLIWTEIKNSSALFSDQKIGGCLGPLPRIFFPRVTGSKFWDSHSVQLSQKPNLALETTYSPKFPVGGAASYKLWLLFIYSNGYYELYKRFQWEIFRVGVEVGRGKEDTWKDLSMGEFIMREKNFHEGGVLFAEFSSII